MGARALAVALVLSVAAGAASADTFRPIKHGTFSFDLDTADGAFSVWKLDDVSDIDALRARITFLRKGKGEYAPTMTLAILAGEQRAVLQFLAFPKSGPLVGYVYDKAGSKGPASQLVLTPPDFKEPFDVVVRWTPEGKVSFDIFTAANKKVSQGFEHHELALGAAVTGVQISNSTGEVEFGKLELGNMAP